MVGKKAMEMIPWGLKTQNRSAVAFAARVSALWQSEPGEIGTDPAGATLQEPHYQQPR